MPGFCSPPRRSPPRHQAANIMIGQFGEVYLLDWGLALAYRDPVTELTGMPRVQTSSSICSGTPPTYHQRWPQQNVTASVPRVMSSS